MVAARHFDFYASCLAALVAGCVGALIWKDVSFLDFDHEDASVRGAPVATISASRNVVRKKSGSLPLWSAAGTTDSLHADDYVFTDQASSATLAFVGHDAIELGQNTMIQVQRFQSEASLDLLKGTLRTEGGVTKPLLIKLGAKGAVLRAAAGSRVNVRADASGKTDVTVLQGEAEILQGQSRLSLKAAQSAKTADDGTITKSPGATALLGAPLHEARFILRADEAVSFTWTLPKDGGRAWFELAADESFSDLVVQEETSADHKTLRALTPGSYYWRVRTVGGAEERRFTVAPMLPPALLWPENDVMLGAQSSFVLVWKSVGVGRRYAVEISSQDDFATPIVKGTSDQTTYAAPPLSVGRYYWRVKDADQDRGEWSAVGRFTVGEGEERGTEPAKEEAPDLLPPPDLNDQYEIEVPRQKDGAFLWERFFGVGTAYAADFPVIRWPAIEDARSYAIQIAKSEVFDKILREEDVLAPLFSFEGFGPGTYYLRIATRNARGAKGAYSKPVKVVISSPSPRLVAPAEGGSFAPTVSFVFDWRRVEGAGGYVVEIARDAAFKTIVRTERPPLSSVEVKGLDPGAYFWRVSAVFKDGAKGRSSAVARFSITAPLPDPVAVETREAAPAPLPPPVAPAVSEPQTQLITASPPSSEGRARWSLAAGAAPTRFGFDGGSGKPDLRIHATLYNSFYADGAARLNERWEVRMSARRFATELFSADDKPSSGQQPVKIVPVTARVEALRRLVGSEAGGSSWMGVTCGVARQTLLIFSEDEARFVSVEHVALLEPMLGGAGELVISSRWRLGGEAAFAFAPHQGAAKVEHGSRLTLDVSLQQNLSSERLFARYGYRWERARHAMALAAGGGTLQSGGDSLAFGLGIQF